MRVFVAGATGVIGIRIVPLLLTAGHDVAGMTRTPTKAETLRALGAQPFICDVYDAEVLLDAVNEFAPDVVVNELTDLPDDVTQINAAANARMRIEGHGNLLAAAGTAKLVVQSVAWPLDGDGAAAVESLERSTLAVGGVVLRYGRFYGPGTYSERELPPAPRVQIGDAARRTVEALDAPSGVIVIA